MVYIRGQPGDFDDWEAAGNPGWGWKDVLPYFQKAENNALGDGDLRGVGGPLDVADASASMHPLCQHYLRGCAELGFEIVKDMNGPRSECVGPLPDHDAERRARLGRDRVSPAGDAAAEPSRRHRGARDENPVRGIAGDRRRVCPRGADRARAGRREVILSAGSVNSPQLLQLSGVGPGDVLQRHGIPVVRDMPAVGRNLQDHLGMDYLYRSRLPTLNNDLYPWHGKLRAGLRYVLTRRGPLCLSVNQGGGFIRTRESLTRPNIQLYFSPVSYLKAPPGTRPLMNPDPYAAFLLGFSTCRPESRGHIRDRLARSVRAAGNPSELSDRAGGHGRAARGHAASCAGSRRRRRCVRSSRRR